MLMMMMKLLIFLCLAIVLMAKILSLLIEVTESNLRMGGLLCLSKKYTQGYLKKCKDFILRNEIMILHDKIDGLVDKDIQDRLMGRSDLDDWLDERC